MIDFQSFQKIPRLFRPMTITEKIDGCNSSVYILEKFDGMDLAGSIADLGTHVLWAGSRNRWITPESDNHGFARWVQEHAEELLKLGVGHHFGEWWGWRIQRGYDLSRNERRFSLFNVSKWSREPETEEQKIPPACCHVVPILYQGPFSTETVEDVKTGLEVQGSAAAPGYQRPEGVMVYHAAANHYFKSTIIGDDQPKGQRR